MSEAFRISVNGAHVEARPGETVIQACDAAGVYIPRLCHHPELKPAGHCRMCVCDINGRRASACTTPAEPGMVIVSENADLVEDRRALLEMLFVEGNHFCPTCEKSGDCELQALAYRLAVSAPRLPYAWPKRDLDATHPDVFIDRNTCILCSRCIRASRDLDGKSLFAFSGRGRAVRLNVDSTVGLGETEFAAVDKAARLCPVGCIVIKRTGYRVPYGERRFDTALIGAEIEARAERGENDADGQ